MPHLQHIPAVNFPETLSHAATPILKCEESLRGLPADDGTDSEAAGVTIIKHYCHQMWNEGLIDMYQLPVLVVRVLVGTVIRK